MPDNIENQRLAYSIDQFCQLMGIGRSLVYLQIKAGNLRVVKLGRRTLVPADEAKQFMTRLTEGAV